MVTFNYKEEKRVFELRSVDPHILHHILCNEFKIPVETFIWYVKKDLEAKKETIIPEPSFPSFGELEKESDFELRCHETQKKI